MGVGEFRGHWWSRDLWATKMEGWIYWPPATSAPRRVTAWCALTARTTGAGARGRSVGRVLPVSFGLRPRLSL